MAYRAAVVGGSGYTGAELLRLLAGHPEIEVVAVTADSNVGRVGVASCTRRSPPPTRRSCTRRSTPPTSPASTSCSSGCRTASRRRSRARSSTPSATSSTSAPTSGSRAPTTSSGTARRTPRPSCSTSSRSACPSCSAPRSAPRSHVAAPGCYPTAASLALAPLLRDGLVEPTGIVVDAVSGVSGAGRGLKVDEPVRGGQRERRRVRPADASPHRRDRDRARARRRRRPVQVLFTPHLVPMTRGILATCYARPAVDGLSTAALLDRVPRVLRRRAVRRRERRIARDEGHARLEHAPRHRALRPPHRHRARARRARQPREGRVGPGDPVRQPAPRPPRDHRPPARLGPACRERS